jgi:5-methylcytosine-specific restriction endonuclease McrA
VTVSARFLRKLAAARDGLSHAQPGATTEQVLEAALDLLLQRQARHQALVKRPRAARGKKLEVAGAPEQAAAPTQTRAPASARIVPAAVEREVRLRDGNRCQFPLDSGGVCGSTHQVQLDHVHPLALGGSTTVANLRCTCALHNRRAAELKLGPAIMAAARHRSRRG